MRKEAAPLSSVLVIRHSSLTDDAFAPHTVTRGRCPRRGID